MKEEPTQEKSFFSDLSWKTALMSAVLAIVVGGGSGAGIVATKSVQAQGLTEDKADVKYLTKEEANQRRDGRDKQLDAIDKKMIPLQVFDAYHNNDERRMDAMDKKLDTILENMNRVK